MDRLDPSACFHLSKPITMLGCTLRIPFVRICLAVINSAECTNFLLQEVLNLLPDVDSPQFVEAHNVQTNDQLMCVYLGALARTVIALHNLIDNKASS